MSNPVARLHQDLQHLRHARQVEKQRKHELHHDQNVLAKDRKEHKADKRHGDREHKALDAVKKALVGDRKVRDHKKEALSRDVAAKNTRMTELETQRASLQAQFDASGDPAVKAQLDAVIEQQTTEGARFDQKIAADQTELSQAQAKVDSRVASAKKHMDAILSIRKELKQDVREIKHEKRVVKTDHKQLDHAHQAVKNDRHRALKHLRPAEYKMGLKATNRARKELGLKAVHHVIRPMNLHTVQGCAQFLLHSKNVSFWTGLSTGSDRKNLERLAHGQPAYVPATGGHVFPKLSLMRALVDMAKHGHIMINALTGGTHSVGSNHYRGTAVDLDVSTGNAGMIESIARKYGGIRNYETDHIHLDF